MLRFVRQRHKINTEPMLCLEAIALILCQHLLIQTFLNRVACMSSPQAPPKCHFTQELALLNFSRTPLRLMGQIEEPVRAPLHLRASTRKNFEHPCSSERMGSSGYVEPLCCRVTSNRNSGHPSAWPGLWVVASPCVPFAYLTRPVLSQGRL